MLRFEVGLVSTDRALVDFFAEVFQLEELSPIESGPGTVHRLQLPGAVLKVMVPSNRPAVAGRADPFFTITGLRYLTIGVEDLDAVIARAISKGGRVQHGPIELGAGVRIAVLEDTDGNTIEVVQDAP